jgi:asparagine synthase (glutamine-hydrolysing)
MAAATDRITRGNIALGWPQWIASLAERSQAEVPGFSRTQLDRGGSTRSFVLFCSPEGPRPIYSSAGDRSVVFEGNLYNASDLATRLEIPERASDTAFILQRAYERWAEDFISELRGIFSLVLWDEGRDTLIAARDALGIYPLFFARGSQELLVSTSVDALLKHPQVSRRVNRVAIVDYLTDSWPRLQDTFYESVKRVPPGSVMRSRRGSESVSRYWNPKIVEKESDWIEDDDGARFDQLLTQAVDRALEYGPTGIFVSGGLDSVGVAAVAADRTAARGLPTPQALSIAFQNSEADEEERQRAVAQQLGLPQLMVPFEDPSNPKGSLRQALELNLVSSFPVLNIWLPRYNYLAERGKEMGCRAILTGTGGDEWLGLSPYLAGDMLRSLDFVGFYRLWLIIRRSFNQTPLKQAWILFWRFGMRAMLRAATIQQLQRISPDTLAAIRRRKRAKSLPAWLVLDSELEQQVLDRFVTSETITTRDPGIYGLYFAESRLSLDHSLVSWEFEEGFENSRRLGIRYIHPYCDKELIEILWRTAPSLLTRGGRAKGLLRESVSRRFPGLGFETQKKVEVLGFFASIVRKESPGIWKELGGAKALAKLGIIDAAGVDTMLQTMFTSGIRKHVEASKAFFFMNLEYWLRSRI